MRGPRSINARMNRGKAPVVPIPERIPEREDGAIGGHRAAVFERVSPTRVYCVSKRNPVRGTLSVEQFHSDPVRSESQSAQRIVYRKSIQAKKRGIVFLDDLRLSRSD